MTCGDILRKSQPVPQDLIADAFASVIRNLWVARSRTTHIHYDDYLSHHIPVTFTQQGRNSGQWNRWCRSWSALKLTPSQEGRGIIGANHPLDHNTIEPWSRCYCWHRNAAEWITKRSYMKTMNACAPTTHCIRIIGRYEPQCCCTWTCVCAWREVEEPKKNKSLLRKHWLSWKQRNVKRIHKIVQRWVLTSQLIMYLKIIWTILHMDALDEPGFWTIRYLKLLLKILNLQRAHQKTVNRSTSWRKNRRRCDCICMERICKDIRDSGHPRTDGPPKAHHFRYGESIEKDKQHKWSTLTEIWTLYSQGLEGRRGLRFAQVRLLNWMFLKKPQDAEKPINGQEEVTNAEDSSDVDFCYAGDLLISHYSGQRQLSRMRTLILGSWPSQSFKCPTLKERKKWMVNDTSSQEPRR